jgi:hypothetical protein
MANITPPIGVLKVAAIPAPAPAATREIRDQGDALARRHTDNLTQRGAERGTNLDDRAFASDRGATTDRNGGGQGFHQRHYGADHASLVVDRVHHLRHSVALGLRGKIAHQKGHADGTQHRNQDDQRSPRRRCSEHVGVVVDRYLTGEQQIVNEADQIPKQDGAKASHDAKAQRQQRQLPQRQLPCLLAGHWGLHPRQAAKR